MENKKEYALSFKTLCELVDSFRADKNKKPLPKYVHIFLYPIYFICALLLITMLVYGTYLILSRKKEYKNPKKYKKVVKEGIFFTTYEYHER